MFNIPFLVFTTTSNKLTFTFYFSKVGLILGWKPLSSVINPSVQIKITLAINCYHTHGFVDCVLRNCFNVVHKKTSIWWSEFSTDGSFRCLLEKVGIKGNPNSQGILSWIIQILHYYYSKQHKDIENSQIIEQNLVIFSLCSSFCLLHLALLSPSWQQFFSSLNVTSDHSWNI